MITLAVLALLRVGPLCWLALPLVPGWVRCALAVGLASLVWPALAPPTDPAPPLLYGRELLVGLALALVAALPLRAAEAAAGLVDSIRAARSSALGDSWLLLALALFGMVGGPRLWLDALARSYELLPLGRAPGQVGELVVTLGAALFAGAVELAAPVLAARLVAELALGLLLRLLPEPREGADGISPLLRGGGDLLTLGVVGAAAAALSSLLAARIGALPEGLDAALRGMAG